MRLFNSIPSGCILALVLCTYAQAEVYEVIDADGHASFSDTPENKDAKEIQIQ